MTDTLTGRIRSVDIQIYGDVLAVPASIGDTVLYLDDASDFSEDGGYALVDGFVRRYTSADLDLDTITIEIPLAAAHDEGDLIQVWDNATSQLATDLIAYVEVEGSEFADDSLEAIVDHSLTSLVVVGIRGAEGEAVVMQYRGDDLYVIDILGQNTEDSGGISFKNSDSVLWDGTGDPTILLTKVPANESLQIKQRGVELEPTEFDFDSSLNTVTCFPEQKRPGDRFTAYYAWKTSGNPIDHAADFDDEISADGPIFWARLGESSGTTTLDSSGNSRNGTYGGSVTHGAAKIAPGLSGTSTDFGGTGWAEFAPGAAWQRSSPFTAEIWACPNDNVGGYLFCADDAGFPDADRIWNITAESAGRIYSGGSVIPTDAATSPTLAADEVAFLAITWDGTTLRFYKNAVLVGAWTGTAMNSSTTWPLVIGATANGQAGRTYKFNGRLQHAVLFDHALSEDRLLAHYEAGTGS